MRHARIPVGLLDDVPPGQIKVLLAIAQHLNAATSSAVVSHATLIDATGYSPSRLRAHMRALETAGLLRTVPGRGRGRLSEFVCPWHLFTVRRPPMYTPVENPEKRSPTGAFSDRKAPENEQEKRLDSGAPISTTIKSNTTAGRDPRACPHGIMWGDRLDEYGMSTGGCSRCEDPSRAWRTG